MSNFIELYGEENKHQTEETDKIEDKKDYKDLDIINTDEYPVSKLKVKKASFYLA